MTRHHHVPSEDDVATLDRLIERARDTECGCAEHGVELHPPARPLRHDHVDVVIGKAAVDLVEGCPGYGDRDA